MNDCCQDPENRADGVGPRGGDEPDGVTVTHCVVCECRHYEVDAEAGELGVLGTG